MKPQGAQATLSGKQRLLTPIVFPETDQISRSSPEERLPTVTITEAQSNPYNSQTDNYSPITPAASTAFLSPAPDANSCASAMLSSSVTPTPKSSHFFFRSHCSAKPRSSQAEISKLRTESQVQTTRLDTATAVHAQVSKYAKEGSWLGYSINTPDDARREIYDLAKSKAQEDKAKVEGELTNALIAYSKVNGTHSRWSVPARHLWGEACRGFKEDPSVKSLVDGHFKEAESEVMERLRLSEAGQQVQQDF
jgi:hypothetical protein